MLVYLVFALNETDDDELNINQMNVTLQTDQTDQIDKTDQTDQRDWARLRLAV